MFSHTSLALIVNIIVYVIVQGYFFRKRIREEETWYEQYRHVTDFEIAFLNYQCINYFCIDTRKIKRLDMFKTMCQDTKTDLEGTKK